MVAVLLQRKAPATPCPWGTLASPSALHGPRIRVTLCIPMQGTCRSDFGGITLNPGRKTS